MPGDEPWRYYGTERALSPGWVNRVTRLSLRELLTFDATSAAEFLAPTPALVVQEQSTRTAHQRALVGVPESDALSPTGTHDHAADDLEAIRRTVADAQRYQSGLEPMLGLHTEDTIIVNIAGRRVIDRDAFRHAMQQALASPLADVTVTVDIDDIRFVAELIDPDGPAAAAKVLLDQLAWWAEALREARSTRPYVT